MIKLRVLFVCMMLIFTALQLSIAQKQDKHMHNQANKHMHSQKFDTLVSRFEDPKRAEWQQPDKVIALMGNLDNTTVYEIGAGTGYFSFKISPKAQKVIAADVDDRFLEFIQKKKETSKQFDNLETRKIPFDSPSLASEEVDLVFLVNVYHHIESREAYFKKVKNGLRKKGRLMIVDFKKGDLPHGPPDKMKFSAEHVIKELETAGFTKIKKDENTLEYQYIIIAE